MSRLPFLLLVLLPCHLLTTARADDPAAPPPLSDLFRQVARLEVPVEEISGMSALPGAPAGERHFLVVSDEGSYQGETDSIRGSLFRVRLAWGSGDDVTVAGVDAVSIDLAGRIPRIDPLWSKIGGQPDLESCVPLPGTEDLFLIGGERNPQDASDGGANRLYVIHYPAGSDGRAELLSYLRLPDLFDDTINDRFEAVVAVATPTANRWLLGAFKERTSVPDRAPVYFPAFLERIPADEPDAVDRFRLEPVRPKALIENPARLSSQADACLAQNGVVWILDRWRRELHLATPVMEGDIGFTYGDSLDYFDAVEGITGENRKMAMPGERRAPQGRYPGFGRHEAICFDAKGYLYLAADLGGGRPSTVTVLAPR